MPARLQLSDEEAAATLAALLTAREAGGAVTDGVDGAIAALCAAMPEGVQAQAQELLDVDPAVLATLADAARENRRVRIRHARADGPPRDRDVDPYAVVHTDGHWYLAAFDHLRDAVRTFRVDRVDRASDVSTLAPPAPADFNAAARVGEAFVEGARTLAAEVWVDAEPERVRVVLAPADVVAAPGGGTLVTATVSDVEMLARALASLGTTLEVRAPAELRDAVARLGALLSASALRGS